MGNEIWKPIIMEEYDFSKFYLISNYGRVCSLRTHNGVTNRILKPSIDTCGYQFVTLYYDTNKNKKYKVQRLVAQHFIPNPYNLPEVNHKDENKLNNYYLNLEWCTRLYNVNYGNRTTKAAASNLDGGKSVPIVQLNLDGTFVKEWISCANAARTLGVNDVAIRNCCNHKTKTSHGFIWVKLSEYNPKEEGSHIE